MSAVILNPQEFYFNVGGPDHPVRKLGGILLGQYRHWTIHIDGRTAGRQALLSIRRDHRVATSD